MSLQLWRVSGSAPLTTEPLMDGPEFGAPALGITSAAFGTEGFTIVMEDPEKMRRLLPLDERSFLCQHGSELRRLDLPEVTLRADQVEAATAAALGVRKDEHGELRILTSGEFRTARARVR